LKLVNILNDVLIPFSHGKITNFVESACWPDDLKQYKMGEMDSWHFTDIPVTYDESLKGSKVPVIPYCEACANLKIVSQSQSYNLKSLN